MTSDTESTAPTRKPFDWAAHQEDLGRAALAAIALFVLALQLFDAGVHAGLTTLGLLAFLLVLVLLPRIEKFRVGAVSVALRERVAAVAATTLPPLGPDDSDRDRVADEQTTELLAENRDQLLALAILRGALRDRLTFISHTLLDEDCCQDPISTIERLRESRYIDAERARLLFDVLIAAEQILGGGEADVERLSGFLRSAGRLQGGLEAHVFEQLAFGELQRQGASVSQRRDAGPDFLVEFDERLYLVEVKLAMRPQSALINRTVLNLSRALDQGAFSDAISPRGLIIVPNRSRAPDHPLEGPVRILTLDQLREGNWGGGWER